jgi:pimeloyl-ACP methyl ester carboxylesterase
MNLNMESLKYATSDQAIEDIANFMRTFVQKYNFKHPKFVLMGCSYPGTLTTRFRQKYSNLTQGAVASSAPLYPQVNFTRTYYLSI